MIKKRREFTDRSSRIDTEDEEDNHDMHQPIRNGDLET